MEWKVLDAPEFKLRDEGNGGFTGYASVFGNRDLAGEIVVKGAFVPHLAKFRQDGFVAVGHDWSALPVATVRDAYEDDIGLLVDVDYHSHGAAQDARRVQRERMERGKGVKLSIGYTVKRDRVTPEARLLEEIELHEVSLVTVPANPLASVLASKALDGDHLAFMEFLQAAETVVRGVPMRVEDRMHFRAAVKEGRMLSEPSLQQIAQVMEAMMSAHQMLADLVAAAKPKPKGDPSEDAKLFRQHMERQPRLRKLGVKTA